MFGKVARKGQLHEDTVHRGVVVCIVDFLDELCFGNVFRELSKSAKDVCLNSQFVNKVTPEEICLHGRKHTSSAAFNFIRT